MSFVGSADSCADAVEAALRDASVAVASSPGVIVVSVEAWTVRDVECASELVRAAFSPEVLVGASGPPRSPDHKYRVQIWVLDAPDLSVRPLRLTVEASVSGSERVHGLPALPDGQTALALLLADKSFPPQFLPAAATRRGIQIVGGYVPSAAGPRAMMLQNRVVTSGAVGVLIEGGVSTQVELTHCCKPVGAPFTVTRAEGCRIEAIAGRPATDVLSDQLGALTDEERVYLALSGQLFVGLLADERRARPGRGDFLVRNIDSVDLVSGAIEVSAPVWPGLVVQFQVFDGALDLPVRSVGGASSTQGAVVFDGSNPFRWLPDTDDASLGASITFQTEGEFGPSIGPSELHACSIAAVRFESRLSAAMAGDEVTLVGLNDG